MKIKNRIIGAEHPPLVIAEIGINHEGNITKALKMIEDAMKAGAAGVAMGRNSFQHKNPTKFVKAVSAVVNKGKTAKEALKLVR